MPTTPIDWSQLWYPGPRRAFSADEMARAGSDSPSPTLLAVAAINIASLVFVVLTLAPAEQTARLLAALLALLVLGIWAARWLWWRPWRRPLLQAQLGLAAALLLMVLGIRWRIEDRAELQALALVLTVGISLLVTALWFLVVWRAHHIEGRLREQAEREKAIEMARRLAAAQMEPHVLFNTLASVQHWVQTRDERAAPLLAALTGYLRATLPLFNKPLLALHEELTAVQRYVEVMQARMGTRLAWQLDVEASLHRQQLPPGVLLTLVENAIVHGLEPQLAGGQVRLRGQHQGSQVHIDIIDNGPGPSPLMHDGVGLANIRQRLHLAFGTRATLTLSRASGGGCCAHLELPVMTATA